MPGRSQAARLGSLLLLLSANSAFATDDLDRRDSESSTRWAVGGTMAIGPAAEDPITGRQYLPLETIGSLRIIFGRTVLEPNVGFSGGTALGGLGLTGGAIVRQCLASNGPVCFDLMGAGAFTVFVGEDDVGAGSLKSAWGFGARLDLTPHTTLSVDALSPFVQFLEVGDESFTLIALQFSPSYSCPSTSTCSQAGPGARPVQGKR